ncbi:MAG TPA: hypothetical protein VFW96_29160 [Thermomicrobiales bacterium]|nr:hypothetical protein [Thermomicrobiales bacterium]
MGVAGQRARTAPPSLQHDPAARRRQVRLAWTFLSAACVISLLLCTAVGGAAYWYRGHATAKQVATVEVVGGDRAYVRAAYQTNWNAVPLAGGSGGGDGTSVLHEGDTLRTEEGTHVLLTLWDGSTIEVFERTQLQMAEMRTTQYISRAKSVTIRQTRGLLRVSPAPDDYSRSRFQVIAGNTTVLMKEGGQRTSGGSFLVDVTLGPDGESIAQVRASVRRGVGAVRAGGAEVRLDANEQSVVPAGGAPGAPTAARRDLVANGTFAPSGADPKTPFAPWRDISTPGRADGAFGTIRPVSDTIDGRPVTAVEFSRSLDSTDPALTGLSQQLDVTVADLVSLQLTADIKVLAQNVPGGGVAGSEFPIIVKITYHDASGVMRERTWGFYVVADPASPPSPAGTSTLVTVGQWTPLRVDLRDLTPQPMRLDTIEVYASGHGYRARITDVAIIGTE